MVNQISINLIHGLTLNRNNDLSYSKRKKNILQDKNIQSDKSHELTVRKCLI